MISIESKNLPKDLASGLIRRLSVSVSGKNTMRPSNSSLVRATCNECPAIKKDPVVLTVILLFLLQMDMLINFERRLQPLRRKRRTSWKGPSAQPGTLSPRAVGKGKQFCHTAELLVEMRTKDMGGLLLPVEPAWRQFSRSSRTQETRKSMP